MAQAAAARLITKIVDAQASRGSASVVLTGGRNGNGLLAALAAAPARDAIDWGRLDLWWGDERFLPEGDPERNVTQAREALLDAVPLDPKRVHAMPASDGPYGTDVDAAAEAYAAELAAAAGPENHGPVPTVRRADAGRRPGHACGVAVPGAARGPGDGAHGGGRPRRARSRRRPGSRSRSRRSGRRARCGCSRRARTRRRRRRSPCRRGRDPGPGGGRVRPQRTLWLLDAAAASQLPRSLYPPASPDRSSNAGRAGSFSPSGV